MKINFWTASCSCFILAALFAVLSGICRYLNKNKKEYSSFTEGRVVHIETEPADSGENRTEFHDRQYAVIEFFSRGRLVKVKGPVFTYPYPYHIGQKLHICYDPEQPEHYQIITDRRWQHLASVAYGISLFLMAGGCIFFLMYAARITL
ncbi:MAG: DUF3592 domain-containing protein [Lachnospiraceae bacterium]|nr:DUF3592 domain-containing protein [Lachnospiraceae bacterium]